MFSRKAMQLPPPDTAARLHVQGHRTIETSFTSDHRYRVTITQDESGIYRIHSDRWCVEDWHAVGKAFWIQVERGSSMTDTIENARRLANEHLTLLSS